RPSSSATDDGPLTTDHFSSFRLPDLIPQLRGAFVIFGLDRLGQFLANLSNIDLFAHRHAGAAAAGWHFANMMCRVFVGALQQRRQIALKERVVLLTSEQTALAELGPGDAAVLAGRSLLLLQARVLQ